MHACPEGGAVRERCKQDLERVVVCDVGFDERRSSPLMAHVESVVVVWVPLWVVCCRMFKSDLMVCWDLCSKYSASCLVMK